VADDIAGHHASRVHRNGDHLSDMKTIYGINIAQTLREVCDPRQVALLVYDMQVGILSQIKNPEEITGQVLKVLGAARGAGVRVFFSRHLSLPKELMGMSQSGWRWLGNTLIRLNR
jgi:molybdate-binding protein